MERAQGVRIEWGDLPRRVRDAIEERLGSRVVDAQNQPGGFSPGLAARILTEEGRRAFLKTLSPTQNPDAVEAHRREARIAAALPSPAPVSRLLWVYDEGDAGWIVLAFEDVPGHLPTLPWQPEELKRVVAAIVAMHESLTPSPLDLPSISLRLAAGLRGWQFLNGDEPGIDEWSRRHLTNLAKLEADAPAAAVGATMLHGDLRADNILLTPDRVVIVDWPGAAIGAAWVDMIGMAPSVLLEGGPEPAEFFALHPEARTANPAHVNAVLASIAGFFTYNALQPPPPGLPTLRDFQAAQGVIARRWLSARLGLD